MTLIAQDTKTFHEVVQSAAARLVTHEVIAGGHYVTLPLIYASGSYVVIRIERAEGTFLVSDFGAGFEEAQLIGGEAIYRKVARAVAETHGIDFDDHSLLRVQVGADQLPGALATVANASQEAVGITALRVSERRHQDDSARLHDRLGRVFGKGSIARDAHVLGASNTEWLVSSLVTIGDRQVAFEPVSKHPNSIVHAAAKFSDIARLPRAPGRVAVVSDKKALGTYLGVLSHSADVIEARVGDETYRRLVEAA